MYKNFYSLRHPGRAALAMALSVCLAGGLAFSGPDLAMADTGTIAYPVVTTRVSMDADGLFNGWKFKMTTDDASTEDYADAAWEDVTLPHDFSITQDFSTSMEAESGFLPGGTGWYRKTFSVPESESGNRVWLTFDGSYKDTYIYLNGEQVGENHYGYNSFTVDLTDQTRFGEDKENTIAVKVVHTTPSSRWYSGSGIFRDVTLSCVPQAHLDDYGVKVTTPDAPTGGTVSVSTTLTNDGDAEKEVAVTQTVLDQSGNEKTSSSGTVTITAGGTASLDLSMTVSDFELWDLDNPTLYTLKTELSEDGEVTQESETNFGFRSVGFAQDEGFLLNGEKLKLNGVCMHHDQGALGSAARPEAMRRQILKLKEMGVNAIRTSHNPHAKEFVELCDELGMLVLTDCFDGWDKAKNSNTHDFSQYFLTELSGSESVGASSGMTWGEFAMRRIVLRDRNSPSVIGWCIGNEIQEGASVSDNFPTIGETLNDVYSELDGTRIITLGNNGNTSTQVKSVQSTNVANGGIIGINYNAGSYSTWLSSYGIMLATETSSATNSRGIYNGVSSNQSVDGSGHLTSYDTSAVSWGLSAHDSMYKILTNDNIIGEFVWTGFDYIGEPTPYNKTSSGSSTYGAAPNSSYFGIIDTAGFEKDTFYLYQAQWRNDGTTTLHIVNAWDSDNQYLNSDSRTRVDVYSNAPKVKLYRNGDLVGSAERTVNTTSAGYTYYTYTVTSEDTDLCTASSGSGSSALFMTFWVTYADGYIEAKAFDENDNEITDTSGTDIVTTPGTASIASVTLEGDDTATGKELKYVDIDITDDDGTFDTTADLSLTVTLSGNGRIVGVDNGDEATTAKYQQSSVLLSDTEATIKTFAGKALVIVESDGTAGEMTVSVSGDSLTGSSVSITTEADDDAENGLSSYTMVKEYAVRVGSTPELLTNADGVLTDGSAVTGTITWNSIPDTDTAGDYTVTGTLSFDRIDPIAVTATLHVIDDVIALRNVSTVTTADITPILPATVSGVLADATLSGTFSVEWDLSGCDFSEEGSIVTVNGVGTIFGDETLPVTCTVRVLERDSSGGTNLAPIADSLTESPANGDTLEAIRDENIPADEASVTSSDKWSNWSTKWNYDSNDLTFTWATAQLIDRVNLYFLEEANGSVKLPKKVSFAYSLDGTNFTEIGYVDPGDVAAFEQTEYVLDSVINPVAFRITLTQQGWNSDAQDCYCVGLVEVEIMSYELCADANTTAALTSITNGGVEITGFAPETYSYKVSELNTLTALASDNAAVTILSEYEGVVRILVLSEDGSTMNTYAVSAAETSCSHTVTETQGKKEASCEDAGYTGDVYCSSCGDLVSTGTEIPATGHDWDDGLVTKEATESEVGIKLYTCKTCGKTKEETIPATGSESSTNAGVTVLPDGGYLFSAEATSGSTDGEAVRWGIVFIAENRCPESLTKDTPGRLGVEFDAINEDGTWSFVTKGTGPYAARAYVVYQLTDGTEDIVYSDTCVSGEEAEASGIALAVCEIRDEEADVGTILSATPSNAQQ